MKNSKTIDNSPDIGSVTVSDHDFENPMMEVEFGGRAVRLVSILARHRQQLGKWALAGIVIGVLLAILLPSQYQSTIRLMPPDSGGGELAFAAALSGRLGALGLDSDMLGGRSSSALVVSVLQSDRVCEHVIDRFNLRKVYRAKKLEDARRTLDNRTEVMEDRRSGIVRVTVTDKDPLRAADIANGYAEELNRTLSSVSTSAARREREFLDERVAHVKADLEKATQELSVFSSEHGAIDMQAQARAMLEAGASLQGSIVAAESELQGLLQIYTPENARVRSVQGRINELKRQMNQMAGVAGPGESGPITNQAYPSLRELPTLGVKYSELYRNTKIQEAIYGALVQKYELAKVQEAREIPTIKILDRAHPPEKRSGPNRAALLLLCTVLSVCFGSVFIIGRIRWDQRPPNDPLKLLGTELWTVSAGVVRSKRLLSWRDVWPPKWRRRNASNGGDSSPDNQI